ncbi:MAG TPA: Gfo/Idh/MocA family oxidoreductase [Terracidiphilus sp.]|nr:Gfo/Idh/MocA family oxidoreductase [Terracidiphilus sp.]
MLRTRLLAALPLLLVAVTVFSQVPTASTRTLQSATEQDSRLRVAIVGLEHGHVEGFLHALPQHSDVELVGIAEADSGLIEKYQHKYDLDPKLFFKSEANMIEVRHPAAVLVYTPISEHRHAIEIAAQYGVPSMVEKPLTISYEDALAIQKVAREHHVQVLVNYETTWYASNRDAYNQLNSGQLGELRKVVVHDGHQGPQEIGVPPEFLRWLTDPAQNGAGALYDFGCYGVDLMTWLMHGEAPQTVTAVVNHDKPNLYPRVDDDATIILKYPRAQAVVMASWNWPFNRKDMEVYGSTGYAITVESDKLRVRYQHDRQEHMQTSPELPGDQRDSLSYLSAVLAGRLPAKGDLSALDTNVTVMQILDAARESARTGQTVRLHFSEE